MMARGVVGMHVFRRLMMLFKDVQVLLWLIIYASKPAKTAGDGDGRKRLKFKHAFNLISFRSPLQRDQRLN